MKTVGLDIGGANLKAAYRDAEVGSVPFALWRSPQRLTEQLTRLMQPLPGWDQLAVTMTAELCDCFETRQEGVGQILDAVWRCAAGKPVYVWQTTGRFVDVHQARLHPIQTASANWYAAACYLARQYPTGQTLWIDTGSTTTDIVRLVDGSPAPRGMTDLDRLATGELVYLGADRTPLMALGPVIDWRGGWYRLMAELFATTGDVHLLTHHADEDPNRSDTADGKPRTRRHAATRVLRMVGADLAMATQEEAVILATRFAETLRRRIAEAVWQVVDGAEIDRVVVTGSGDSIAAAAAQVALPQTPRVVLADRIGAQRSAAICALAMVQLMDASIS